MLINRKSLSFIITVLSFIGSLPIIANNKTQQESFATYITNKYLNSNFSIEMQPVQSKEEATSLIDKFNKQLDSQRQILTEREAQEAAFSIVTPLFHTPTTIIDSTVIDKLELIGGGENTYQHLLKILFGDKLHTSLGKAYTAFTFCNPIIDIHTLQNRQKAIILLNSQQKNIQKLNTIFASIEKNEIKSLTYWYSKPILQERLMKLLYFNLGPLKNLNTNTPSLEIANKSLTVVMNIFNMLSVPVGLGYLAHKIAELKNWSYTETIRETIASIKYVYNSPEITINQKAFVSAYVIGIPIFQVLNSYISIRQFTYLIEGTSHLQDILIATSNHINQLKILSSFVNKNKQLVELLPTLKPLAEFNNTKKRSAALNKLLGMLETNTFKGEPSFWSLTGRVLAAHKLMHQVKDELTPIFAAAGELEMYVAFAQLYAEGQGRNATWCMANFVESSTPVIEAQGFWNPFINPDIVVTNDVTFDAQHPNSILTGPNTGGKSTVIKGVMLNALIAQIGGFTAAQSFTFTPFAKLNCFMNIADDIATGASLFKSEVMRAKELSAMIQNLKEDEFSFVIIDEVFTGTSPVEGEQAALRFAKHLTTFPNSIAVIATHYPKMTTLEAETNGKFYNHHVEILRNEDGSLNRTFKLKNGPTFFNVAFDILEEEGLSI